MNPTSIISQTTTLDPFTTNSTSLNNARLPGATLARQSAGWMRSALRVLLLIALVAGSVLAGRAQTRHHDPCATGKVILWGALAGFAHTAATLPAGCAAAQAADGFL